MKRFAAIFAFALWLPLGVHAQDAPLRLAIAGLAHGHVSGFLTAAARRPDARVIAIFDPDAALVASYAKRYQIPADGQLTDLAKLLGTAKPQAGPPFTSTFAQAAIGEA